MMVFVVVNCIVSYIAVINSLKHLKKQIVTLLIIKTGDFCELTITNSLHLAIQRHEAPYIFHTILASTL